MVKLTETGQSAGKNKDFKTLLGVVSERKDIVVLQETVECKMGDKVQ